MVQQKEIINSARRGVRNPDSFSGVFSVLPTPFLADGTVDLASLRRAVRFFIGAGVDGLATLGVTSETVRLSETESAAVLECVFEEAAGRVPILVGASSEALATSIQLSHRAQAFGAAAVMAAPPRMRGSSESVFRYFAALAEAVDTGLVLQDYPAASGVSMEIPLLARLISEIPNVRGIKLEDPPTPPKIAALRAAIPGREVPIFGGLGGAFLLEELIAGAAGAMTGFAFPEVLLHVVRAFQTGNKAEAADVFYRYAPVIRFEAQEGLGLGIRKEFLRRRGVIAHARLREPGAPVDATTMEAADLVLEWSKLLSNDAGIHPWN
jgi:4-hydroxy-tetrahydrodipicolinate synthase